MIILSKKWTQEDEQLILDNYKTISRTEFAKLFDVSKSAINHKFQRLGLCPQDIRGKNYPWTQEEIDYIKENWINMTDEEMWKNFLS